MCYWAAAKVSPQRELVVAERLETLGCVIYVPRARVPLRCSRRTVILPLFATYIFVDLDLSPVWQMVRRQPGVITVLLTGDTPSRCPESEILKLKGSEIDGLVQLSNEPPPPSAQKFTEGEAVRIRLGAFEGRSARYSKAGKRNMSTVLVTLLNRIVAVQVPTHLLASLAN
jgi:transcription antitermination factor NusG